MRTEGDRETHPVGHPSFTRQNAKVRGVACFKTALKGKFFYLAM